MESKSTHTVKGQFTKILSSPEHKIIFFYNIFWNYILKNVSNQTVDGSLLEPLFFKSVCALFYWGNLTWLLICPSGAIASSSVRNCCLFRNKVLFFYCHPVPASFFPEPCYSIIEWIRSYAAQSSDDPELKRFVSCLWFNFSHVKNGTDCSWAKIRFSRIGHENCTNIP